MAILKGFPPSNLISPSVRIAERDLSFLTADQVGAVAGLIGFASKGPVNSPTLITSARQLHTVFGQAHPDVGDPYLIYAAEQYLQVGSQVYVVRVADVAPTSDTTALIADVDVPTAGGLVVITGNVAEGAGFVFAVDSFFRWRLNEVLASKVLVVLAGTYTAKELVDALNDQLDPASDGIEFSFDNADADDDSQSTSHVIVSSVYSYGEDASIELVSVKDALYGPVWSSGSFGTSILGLAESSTAASVTGVQDRYPSSNATAAQFDTSALADLTLELVLDGTDSVNIDAVVQSITLTPAVTTLAQYVVAINNAVTNGDVPGGFAAVASGNNLKLVTLHSGRDAKLLVKSSGNAAAVFGLSSLTKTGTSASGSSDDADVYNDAIVTGEINSDDTVCFTITADTTGIDGNETQVVVENNPAEGTFSLAVYSYGAQVEVWAPLSKDEANRYYVESYLVANSDYIKVTDNTDTAALPAAGTYDLAGGTDGIPADPDDQDSLLVGLSTAMTGMQSMSDPEQVDIDLVACPGHASTTVVQALIDLCQTTRQDCFAVLDTPFGLTVREVVQWQNGVHPLNDARFDSDFGAIYWPWLKIRDTFNRVDVWVPPSGNVLAAYARNDQLGAPWTAPAGTTRGLVFNVLDAFTRPTLAERDSMYQNRNCVNPIITFADAGSFMIFGQKTLQRLPSALDRVNVRRMLLNIEKRIKIVSRNLLFEPNDARTRERFISLATAILTDVQVKRGVDSFIVKCDTDINTPDVVDRNELRAQIGVIPVHAAEFIFIEFSLHRTGSDFSETQEL